MTVGTLKTQGSELFLLDNVTLPLTPAVLKFACPTGISGLGGAADQLDDTCLDSSERTFKRGLGNPGAVSVPFNFIPTNASHKILFELQEAGDVKKWLIAFSDGTAPPTIAAGAFVPAASRTQARFDAYIADVNIDIATNEIVRGTLTLQRSGPVAWTYEA